MKGLRITIVSLFLIILFGCSNNLTSENPKSEYSKAERFITDKGYSILSNEGIVADYVLEKKLLTEMPYSQYWSVQSVEPLPYVGKRITTRKFIVNNHPLDHVNDNRKKQTLIYVMEADNEVVGGYSYPDYDELHVGWAYTIDGRTLEEFTGISYPEWADQWELKYK